MNWQTHPIAIRLRSAARFLGIAAILGRGRGEYEKAFDDALFANIRPGDCVWDVGANVGHYTVKLVDAVGAQGRVIAFEPSSVNRQALARALEGKDNTQIVSLALGRETKTTYLVQGQDTLGATSKIVTDQTPNATEVMIATADYVVAQGLAPVPDVIKIDTEGYELDVIEGLGKVLSDPRLRVLGVEIHFGLLANRGQASAPRQIENTLKASGFSIQWTDRSHIVATRKA